MEFIIRQTVDLARENSVLHYAQPLEYGDACAHRWMVTINTDGAEADLGAMSAKCYVTRAASDAERAQGVTSVTVIMDAEIDAQTRTVSCVFDAACYGSMGAAAAIMRLSDAAGAKVTAAKLTARLNRSTSDAVCDPKGLIHSLDELLAQIESMEAATDAANTAAGKANAATGKANTAATNANNAAVKIDNMTVSAVSGTSAGADISEKNGAKHIAFTLPKGAKGDPGNTPYIGSNGNWFVGNEDTGTKAQGPAGQNGTGSGTVTAVMVNGTKYEPDGTGNVDIGDLTGGADLSSDVPKPLGTASAGTSEQAARADHIHKMPKAAEVGALAANGTAADSAKLGGKAPEYYIQPRNLLDNSDFTNPVNQRNVSSWKNDYGIDRWLMWEGTATKNDVGVLISSADGNPNILQRLEKGALDNTKTYTAAMCDSYGNITFGEIGHNDTMCYVTFFVQVGKTYVWAALYEGSYTAETLPPYVPKGYAAEFVECRRYYKRFTSPYAGIISAGYVTGSTKCIYINPPDNYPMRINKPSFAFTGLITVRGIGGYIEQDYSDAVITVYADTTGCISMLEITRGDSAAWSATNNTPVAVQFHANSVLELIADL